MYLGHWGNAVAVCQNEFPQFYIARCVLVLLGGLVVSWTTEPACARKAQAAVQSKRAMHGMKHTPRLLQSMCDAVALVDDAFASPRPHCNLPPCRRCSFHCLQSLRRGRPSSS